jgi:hypothetical protein
LYEIVAAAHSVIDDHMSADIIAATKKHNVDYVHSRVNPDTSPHLKKIHSRIDNHMDATTMRATKGKK